MNGQSKRILARLQATPDQEVSAVELHKAGSNKEHGYCASFSRRISDLRKQGHGIVKCRDEWADGQRRTHYKYVTPPDVALTMGERTGVAAMDQAFHAAE